MPTYHIKMPIPELAQEPPTMPLTHGVYIGGRNYWTVAALISLLQDGVARMTPGDLERLTQLGRAAERECMERR